MPLKLSPISLHPLQKEKKKDLHCMWVPPLLWPNTVCRVALETHSQVDAIMPAN